MRPSFPVALMLLAASACASTTPATPATPAKALDAKVTSMPVAKVDKDPADGVPEDDTPIPITKDDPTWGSRSALVTIVEMTDLQCPFCARADKTISRLRETYGPDQLRVVWKHHPLPFHANARPAAEWAQGTYALGGMQAFMCFEQKAFDEQGRLGADAYLGWAKECGVDARAVEAGVSSHRWSDVVDQGIALSAKLHSSGTPAFFINGATLTGAQPYEKFVEMVDNQLAIAKLLLSKGAPRDKLYVIASTVNQEAEAEEAKQDADEPKEDTKTVYKVPVGTSPMRGPQTAPVTIVEFSDFQCPYCKRAEVTVVELRKKYGDKVRIVWKDEPLPFHPRAEPAAELAREARAQRGDAAFWDAHDALYETQPKLDDDDLTGVAQKLGLNVGKVKEALSSHRYKKGIDADADLADDLEASGTPHFFINGRRLVGAQPLEKFTAIIEEELRHADELRGRGIAAAKVYDEMVKDGKGPKPLEKRAVVAMAGAPSRGPANAPIVIQEFSDFQCPFCSRAESTMNDLMKAYPGKVKLVWRNMPLSFHDHAHLAAEAAMEAQAQKGNDAFWKLHDLMYENQKDLSRETLDGYAKKLGLDMTKWANALDQGTHKAAVDKDAKLGSDASVSGTPAFFINGYFLSGAQPFAKFRRVVDQALSDAPKH
jgi:protein-disulfide isomerase